MHGPPCPTWPRPLLPLLPISSQSRTKQISSKDEIKNVATISANSDHSIGQLIADAMEKVGKEGVITVQVLNSRSYNPLGGVR